VKVTGISGWREVVQANTALGDYANRLREERKVLDARLIAEKERVANLAAKNRALQEQVDRGLIGKIARVLNTDVRRVFGLRKSGNR
jgi:hypothetical protein